MPGIFFCKVGNEYCELLPVFGVSYEGGVTSYPAALIINEDATGAKQLYCK